MAAGRGPGNHRFCLRNRYFTNTFRAFRIKPGPRFPGNYPTIDDEYFFSLSETFFSLKNFVDKKYPLVEHFPLSWLINSHAEGTEVIEIDPQTNRNSDDSLSKDIRANLPFWSKSVERTQHV